jgi:hypothetical protein
MRVETRQKLESEKSRVYAQKPRLNQLFKNSISGIVFYIDLGKNEGEYKKKTENCL